MKKQHTSHLKLKIPSRRIIAASLFVAILAFTGLWFLAFSKASTYVVAIEAESGTRSGGATQVSDSGASNGSSVKFATATTPPITPPPATPKTIKLMPLGDSITLGSDGGYRTQLWQKMVQTDGKKIDFVGSLTDGPSSLGDRNHEGHSGWRIDQLRAQIDGWSNSYKPNLVLLHIGTNDMNQNYNLSAAPSRLQDLVNRICSQNAGVELIVASIVPINGKSSQVNAYNSAIPGIVDNAKGAGCKASFFDMNKSLTTSDLADGTHPSISGYNKMAAAWYPVANAAYDRLQAIN